MYFVYVALIKKRVVKNGKLITKSIYVMVIESF